METTNNRQTALITGGTGGIGYELAKLFARDGYDLVLVARSQDELDRAAQWLMNEFSISVTCLAKDLFRPESPQEIYDELKNRGQSIQALVNDAGQGVYGLFKDTDLDRELDIIQLNIAAPVRLAKLFLADMLAAGEGKILNVGSLAGEAPGPWNSVYHGTKAFINSWTAALRYELKDSNITVTALLPGATDTDFFNKADMQQSKITDTGLADPADVAKDGYEALMSGNGKIVSGFKNKVQNVMANMSSDSMAAASMAAQQEPKEDDGTEPLPG